MELVKGSDFLRWASGAGVGFDPEYPDSNYLCLLPRTGHSRFWILPYDARSLPHFIASLLNGLDEWFSGFLWPRPAHWPETAELQSGYSGDVYAALLRGANVPDGWEGAVRFDREEEDRVLALLFGALAFNWFVEYELFFVPDHGQQVLHTDHLDAAVVACRTEERVLRFASHMNTAGYELPTKPPNELWKWQPWMADRPD